MNKEELTKYLENYKFDSKFLQEKIQEVNILTKSINNDKNMSFMLPTLKYEQEQIAKIIERNKEIEALIYKLPQPYQTVIYFKYISSFSFYEIADKLEFSSKRIYQLHSEGLDKLLEILWNKNNKN